MLHIKGNRFGLPLVNRIGMINDKSTHPIHWNAHRGFEVHFVLKGNVTWEFHGCTPSVTVAGGHLLIVPPRLRHRAAGGNGAPSSRIGVIYEPYTVAMTDGLSFQPADIKRIFSRYRGRSCTARRFVASVRHTLSEIRDAMTGFDITSDDIRLRFKLLNERLLFETYRMLENDCDQDSSCDIIPQVEAWIKEHLTDDITAEALVRRSGYSRSRFFALFLSETGLTPNDYIVRRRIELAKRLIRERPGMTLLEAGALSGFKSSQVFSSTFRKHVGVPPREWRARQTPLPDSSETPHAVAPHLPS